jgi:hypothetical protein
MRAFREIAELVDLLILPLLGRVLLFLFVPVALLVMFAPSACACSTKSAAYRAKLRSDLRNLVAAEQAYYDEHGRYATTLDTTRFRASTGVVIDSIVVTPVGFRARASYPEGTTEHCRVDYGPDWNEESRPTCDGDASGYRAKRKLP